MSSVGAVLVGVLLAAQLLAYGVSIAIAKRQSRPIRRLAMGATIGVSTYFCGVLLYVALWSSSPYDGPHDAIVASLCVILLGVASAAGAGYALDKRLVGVAIGCSAMAIGAPVCYFAYHVLRHPIHGDLPVMTRRIRWVEHDDPSGVYVYAMRAEVPERVANEFASRLRLEKKAGELDAIDEVLKTPTWWHPEGAGQIWIRSDMYANGSRIPDGCRVAMAYRLGELFLSKHCYWM